MTAQGRSSTPRKSCRGFDGSRAEWGAIVPAGLRPGGAGVSPAGTRENSPPYQRWVSGSPSIPSPVGAKERSRPQGSFVPGGTRFVFWPLFPGINPWAIVFRPPGWGSRRGRFFGLGANHCFLSPAGLGRSGGKRFLRNSPFLRQHAGVKKRLLMVELRCHRDVRDEVGSSE
jgi:hypothetical protein